jgi:nucleotide-binding universal stress UspA family protein
LIVAHVIHHRDVDSVAYAMSMEGLFNQAPTPEEFIKRLTTDRVKKIQGFIQGADAERHVLKIEIVVGYPFDELMKMIQSSNVYMAIIGNKGRGNIAGLLAGSTAQKLLSHCQVPLLCVPSVPEPRSDVEK